MATAFDPRKSAKNIEERGLSFELAHGMEWETALIPCVINDGLRGNRLQVLALIEGRLHVVGVTPRGDDLRVISLRKANKKEVQRYGKG